MIIDRISSPANELLTDKTTSRSNRGALMDPAQGTGVHATLSSDTASVHSLVARAMQTPALRQEKIDALRALTASGSYAIDTGEIASALLSQQIG